MTETKSKKRVEEVELKRFGAIPECSVVGCSRLGYHLIRPTIAWDDGGYVNIDYIGPRYAFCDLHYYDKEKGKLI